MKYILSVLSIVTYLLAACAGSTSETDGETHPSPEFTLPNAFNGEVALSDYAGQPVLLYFHMAVG
jgi:hypothetical protein